MVPKNGASCSMIDPPRGFLVTSLASASGAQFASSDPRRMRRAICTKPTSEGVLACLEFGFAETFAGSTMSATFGSFLDQDVLKNEDFLCCCCCSFNKSSSFFKCGISRATWTVPEFSSVSRCTRTTAVVSSQTFANALSIALETESW